jgi:hypothetical protein
MLLPRLARSLRAVTIVLTVGVPVTACYTQHPLTTPVPVLGTQIVAQLTDTGTVLMANQLGPAVTEIEGVVSEADGNSWKLLMTRVEQRGVGSTFWNREAVTFPRFALTRVTQREFDRKRSWLIAGLIATTAIVAARSFGAFTFGGEGGPDAGAAK